MELKVNKKIVRAYNEKLMKMRNVCEEIILNSGTKNTEGSLLLNAYNIFVDITNKVQINQLVLDQKNLMEFIRANVEFEVNKANQEKTTN